MRWGRERMGTDDDVRDTIPKGDREVRLLL